METLLTMNEVAKLLKVGEATVRRLIETGKLKSVRIGYRTVRIAQTELDAYLKTEGA